MKSTKVTEEAFTRTLRENRARYRSQTKNLLKERELSIEQEKYIQEYQIFLFKIRIMLRDPKTSQIILDVASRRSYTPYNRFIEISRMFALVDLLALGIPHSDIKVE